VPERGSKSSKVPFDWAIFGIFSVWSRWFPVAISDHGKKLIISLWLGDKATISGVAAWRFTLPPKIPSAKIRCKISRLEFLGSRRHPPHWLLSERPNYQRGVLSSLLNGAIEGNFEEKTPRGGKVTKGVFFLLDNAPAHRPLATQKKLAYLGFQVGQFLLDCRELVGRITFWFFFEWLAKVRATG